MIAGLEDWTALIDALGVLVTAVGTVAVKIGTCLSDLRRQTARVLSTATKTKRAVEQQTSAQDTKLDDIGASVNRLNEEFIHRPGLMDSRLERIDSSLERREHRRDRRAREYRPRQAKRRQQETQSRSS